MKAREVAYAIVKGVMSKKMPLHRLMCIMYLAQCEYLKVSGDLLFTETIIKHRNHSYPYIEDIACLSDSENMVTLEVLDGYEPGSTELIYEAAGKFMVLPMPELMTLVRTDNRWRSVQPGSRVHFKKKEVSE